MKRGENMRKSGILLPISSIPSKYGIGTFSKEAYAFVDFLEKAEQALWQILPLGPTGYGDSPYQSFSTYAGNPYFIDLEELIEKGWLTKEECEKIDFGTNTQYISYEKLYKKRKGLLKKAFLKSKIEEEKEYQIFCEKNQFWLKDYALYMAVKDGFQGKSWNTWTTDIKMRQDDAIKRYTQKYEKEIAMYKFQQYLFQTQWLNLKKYANQKGIQIVGDIPIYVAFDSADTWSHPELFQLNENCTPVAVAGCPPDAFSKTGQLWGNPLYDWKYHKKTNYAWWTKRIAYCYKLYDVLRIDHFRGFDEYYSIPYGDQTAEYGKWEPGPGYEIFRVMKKELEDKAVIAEDLGFLTKSVKKLVKKTKYPGMKILLFAFDHREPSDYLPYHYEHNCVVYTGTHDNDTIVGWIQSASKKDITYAKKYLGIKQTKDLAQALIRAALASTADIAIIPIQDYLELDNSARINTPSTLGENWKWRLQKGQLQDLLAEKIAEMVTLYGRNVKKKAELKNNDRTDN